MGRPQDAIKVISTPINPVTPKSVSMQIQQDNTIYKDNIGYNELDNLYLALFGGEPLLEKEKIKEIFETFQGLKVKYQITTNGYLFDEEYFEIFEKVKNNIEITVSLDGREKGNSMRCSEKQTIQIISNINKLIEKGFQINLFTCINKVNKEYLFNDLEYFINEMKISKINLFFVGCGIANYGKCSLSPKERKEFARKFYPFFDKYSNVLSVDNDKFLSLFYEQINSKYKKPFNDRFDYSWVLQPNGFAYSFYIDASLKIADNKQFQITDELELEKYNIHKIVNYNLENYEEKIIHTSDKLLSIAAKKKVERNEYDLSSMYFLVDENCNLDCKYCYEKNKFNGKMSLETVEKSLEYIENNYITNTLVLFGGEPTLNPEACIKILKEAPPEIFVSMSTNGLIYNEELVNAFFERDRAWLQISLDGKYETMKGRLGDNPELFNLILKNVEKYKVLKNRPDGNIMNFHITLTNDNIKYLYENIKITADFKGNWSQLDLFLYENQLRLVMDYIDKEYKQKGKKIPRINTLSDPVPEFISCQPDQPCTAGTSNLMINHKGEIYPCARMYTGFGESFLLGNIYSNDPLKNHIFVSTKMSEANPESCGKCKIPGCIRCYAANLEQTGRVDVCNLNQCEITRINYKMKKEFKQRFKGENGEWK